MKVGDKVRFLSEVGGGTVAGFQGKDIVLVRDEDGFDIPMLMRECVVIDTDDYNIAKVNTEGRKMPGQEKKGADGCGFAGGKPANNRFHTEKPDTYVHSYDDDEDDKTITFQPRPLERKGGDRLNIKLAFVPVDVKELTHTRFEAYLINDSNYYLSFSYLSGENGSWSCRFQGVVEPNTKLFMEEFDRSALVEMEHLTIQAFAYKVDKPFALKEALSKTLRIDGTKFYKLHTFVPTPFFEEPSLVYDVNRE